MNNKRGFTLIELMITVAIVGILAAIALPSYQNSVMKSRRADAKSSLMEFANIMERHATVNNSYLPNPAYTPQHTEYYTISITSNTGSAYTLTAAPIGSQADDECGTLTLSSDGTRTSGATDNSICW